MRITGVQIFNYKSYVDSSLVTLGKKTTVVVGQNNAGKTAFLEALASSTFKNKPHVSPARAGELPNLDPRSRAFFDVILSGAELLRFVLGNNFQFQFPVKEANENRAREVVRRLFAAEELKFSLQHVERGWSSRISPCLPLEPPPYQAHVRVGAAPNRREWVSQGVGMGEADNLAGLVGPYVEQSVYVFRAERMNVGQCAISASSQLDPNASNLASVLLQLNGAPDAQQQFRDCLREIFPHIYDVRAVPIQNNISRINVITRDGAKDGWHQGVTVPLDDCGTGISQVLAILYVVLTSEYEKTVVIDEPNSFLHPGAAKKLIQILRNFPNQYVIATHSAEIISAADPDVVHQIKWTENSSSVNELDRTKVDSQLSLLDELGVRLGDVFGADNVLWVEGQTEERCFPLLSDKLRSSATAVRSLVATGDFESKRVRPELVIDIYDRLSKGTALVPPAVAISLDRENRSEPEMQNLVSRSRGLVKFLPLRTYENYLIHAAAIHAVLTQAMEARAKPSLLDVEKWLEKNKGDARFYDGREPPEAEEDRRKTVDASKLLKSLYSELSDATVAFEKPRRSLEITKWLLENDPGALRELSQYVEGLIR